MVLGPILWNFKNLRMQFSVNGRKILFSCNNTGPMNKIIHGLQRSKVISLVWEILMTHSL